MLAPRLPTLVLVTVVAVTMAVEGLQAQNRTVFGSISGAIFDSTAHQPLVDAAVFLWDTPYRSTTDSAGHFLLDGIPPGDYSLLYFHTRLGEMGISPGPMRVTVSTDTETKVDLATPSVFTLVTSQCLFETPTAGTAVLAGFVADGDTGMGMPGAHVTVSWNSPGGESRHIELRTDGTGWYRTCAAPAEVPIVAWAEFMDRQGLRHEVTLTEGDRSELGFLLFPQHTTSVTGRLVDAESGERVSGAEVWLRGTTFRTITDQSGGFQFSDVEPGEYLLVAEHLAYGTRSDTLAVPWGESLAVEMRVNNQAIEIAPMTVTAESRPLTERAMGGIVIDRASVDRVRNRARDVADILRSQNLPGVIVRRTSNGSVCVGYMPGQVRMMFNNGCVPMVIFINNVRTTNTDLALQLPPEAIDRLVIYKPVEAGNLFGLGSGNGVLSIYTRSR